MRYNCSKTERLSVSIQLTGRRACNQVEMIGFTIQERYRIDSEIGRGGMGVVYQAQDMLLERPVAIKVVSSAGLGSEGRARLLFEAQAAARLNHPNIVAIYDVGTADLPEQKESSSYIVMELVEGRMLRNVETHTVDQMVDITKDICRALEAAHEQNIVHRDLKPENVAVTTSGTVKLMDFGLARITGKTRLTQQGTFMGTVSYLAPEIILGQEASHSSDLYALGVMMYEMSTGRSPFEGGDLTAVLSQHLHAPVVPPGTYNESLPPALDDLIVRLLSKRPEDRPASAKDVRVILERISFTGQETSKWAVQPQLSRLVRGRLIGREKEFGRAVQMWQKAAGGRGGFLLISGEPGIGKTRIARELSTYVEISGGRTLIGYCYEGDRTPYGPIAQMVESSLKNGRGLNLPETVLADLLTLAPELRLQFSDMPLNERLDPEAEQQRLFESIVTWFGALTREGQIMLVVDDIHWSDSGSLSLLRHLARRLERRQALILATYREVELDEGLPFQQMLNEISRERLATRIKLARLSKEHTGELLATLFSEEIPPDFLDGIYRETEGNPFFIEEVCKSLVESGELYFEDGRWQRSEMAALEIPQGIRVTIQSRLGKLSDNEQEVMQTAAMLGREFEYEMVAAVIDLNEDDLIEALERAEQAQLVEEVRRPDVPRGTRFSFTHGLIHSTLLSNLSTLRRQRLQRRVALALEASFPDRVTELAPLLGRYFAEAGEGTKAVQYLLQAGDSARRVYAYDEAIEAYEQALIFQRESGEHQQTARTLMKLGLTYHNALAFDKSRQAYEEAFIERRRTKESSWPAVSDLPDAPHPLRFPTQVLPATLDPAKANDGLSLFFIDLLFSGLVELADDDELMPDVASSWEVLDEGTRYVFHLRDDVSWSDGSPVTAGDFEFALKRVLGPEGARHAARNLFDIKGAEAYQSGRESDPESVGLRALDDKTLELRLEGPSGHFLHVMAMSTCVPLPQKVIEQHGSDWTKPEKIVGNGPFLLQSLSPNEPIILTRNRNYHGRFLGNLKQIEMPIMSHQEAIAAYSADQLDIIFPDQGTLEQSTRLVQQYPDDYWTGPGGNTLHLFFDVRRPPFDDRRMRQAMALAIDRENLINRLWKGFSVPASGGMVPPGIPGHVPDIGAPFDPALARQKASEAGFLDESDWPKFELLVSDGQNIGGIFDAFAEQWQEFLGLTVSITQTDFNTVLEREDKDPAPLMVMGWAADYPDPDTFLRVGSWRLNSRWRHAEYEQLVERARRITDRIHRLAVYRQAERLLVVEAPVIPISYGLNHTLIKPWFESWPSNLNFFILKDVVMYEHQEMPDEASR